MAGEIERDGVDRFACGDEEGFSVGSGEADVTGFFGEFDVLDMGAVGGVDPYRTACGVEVALGVESEAIGTVSVDEDAFVGEGAVFFDGVGEDLVEACIANVEGFSVDRSDDAVGAF